MHEWSWGWISLSDQNMGLDHWLEGGFTLEGDYMMKDCHGMLKNDCSTLQIIKCEMDENLDKVQAMNATFVGD